MSGIQSYKDLIVWQRAIELVVEIYDLTKKLPKNEEFALSNQMRRAVVAIPSNIAEGYLRKGLNEYIQFLRIAISSASELETQLIIVDKICAAVCIFINLYLLSQFKEQETLSPTFKPS